MTVTGLRLAALAFAIAFWLRTSPGAFAQNRIPVFGAERLSSAQNWTESDASFTPSTPEHGAMVNFPANKWSALMGTLPLNGLEGSFSMQVRCRWTSDLTATTGAACALMFLDADNKEILPTTSSQIPVAPGWQEATVKAKVPTSTSYLWDGHNGLEASTPFPEAITRVDRDGQYIYYDVTLPTSVLFLPGGKSAGMSIVFVNQGSDKSVQRIELGEGILPPRDAARMGLLLDKR
jgi:hypothetical protein